MDGGTTMSGRADEYDRKRDGRAASVALALGVSALFMIVSISAFAVDSDSDPNVASSCREGAAKGRPLNSWTSHVYELPPCVGWDVHFWEFKNEHGHGFHIDTNSSSYHSFDFMGLSKITIPVGSPGIVEVSGHFSVWDNFEISYKYYRIVEVFVLDAESMEMLARAPVLDEDYVRGCWYEQSVTLSDEDLYPGRPVKIGVGRFDYWGTDWRATVEAAGVRVSFPSWEAYQTDPSASVAWSPAPDCSSFPHGAGAGILLEDDEYQPASDFDMMGVTTNTYSTQKGKMQIRGHFAIADELPEEERSISIYVLDADDYAIIDQRTISASTWKEGELHYMEIVIDGLAPGEKVRLGFGRHYDSSWGSGPWHLWAGWTGLIVIPTENWGGGLRTFFTLDLDEGLNLFTVPLLQYYYASTLGLMNGDTVSRWDPSTQTYDKIYTVGISGPESDFRIEGSCSYWIDAVVAQSLVLEGTETTGPISRTITVPYGGGYDCIGLISLDTTYLASEVTGMYSGTLENVSMWDSSSQSWMTYDPASPSSDFLLIPGKGLLVFCSDNGTLSYTTWRM